MRFGVEVERMYLSGGRPTQWIDRCRRLLLPLPGCAVVKADPSTGVNHLISELVSTHKSSVWIGLDEYDVDDPVSAGNKFTTAFGKVFGSTIAGFGVPIGHTIAQIQRFPDLVGLEMIAVSRGDLNVDAVSRIRDLVDYGSSLCVVVPEETSNDVVGAWRPTRVVEATQLRLSDQEAIEVADGLLPPVDALALVRSCDGRYRDFALRIRRSFAMPPLVEPAPDGYSLAGEAAEQLPGGLLVDALRRRGAHVEAFEVAVCHLPERVNELIDEAGRIYLGAGMAKRLLRQIERLPESTLLKSDGLMRWWFAALTAENRHHGERRAVERVLASRDAPELRALYAAAFPGPEMVSETLRAVTSLETPVTLRMHGFALGQASAEGDGLAVLLRGLRMAEALGEVDQIVAAATEIGNLHTRRGAYRDGAEWASWALERYHQMGGLDVLRRLAAISQFVYGRLLVDDRVGLVDLVDQLHVSDDLHGMPTVEGIVSTLADWHFVNGAPESAEALYRRNLDAATRTQYHLAALDIIPVLVDLGRRAEARSIGSRARAITRASDSVSRALGELAYVLSECDAGSCDVEVDAVAAVGALADGTNAHRLAQACFALARIRLSREDEVGARQALRLGDVGIRELGPSGVCLLAGGWSQEARIRGLLGTAPAKANIVFLGNALLEVDGRQLSLTRRNAECLALMAAHPDGLSLEQLAIMLYGERAPLGTAKALVSRMRSTIPVTSRPYRIGVSYRADFVEVLGNLNHGRVREALALYFGPLLPESDVPEIVALREHVDEVVRQAVLNSADPRMMLEYSRRVGDDDLALLEEALRYLPESDPQSPILRARVLRIRRDWGAE